MTRVRPLVKDTLLKANQGAGDTDSENNKKPPQSSEGPRLRIHMPYLKANPGSLHRLCK